MITPLDIQNKVFKKEFRGYSSTEVDEFLNQIIDGYEKLYREGIEARDKISSMQETLNHYKALEETLKNTLVVAQSTGEKVQAAARDKAEVIISEAQMTSKKIVNDGHEEVKKISYKYDEIKRSIDVYRARMTALLNSQLDLLGNVASSDKTLVELVGVKEALEELENQSDVLSHIEENIEADEIPSNEILENTAVYSADEFLNAASDSEEAEDELNANTVGVEE